MSASATDLGAREGVIAQALGQEGSTVVAARPGEADIRIGACEAKASWNEDWFTIAMTTARFPAGAPSFDKVQNALHLNAILENLRYVYVPNAREMRLLAEFPLTDLANRDHGLLMERTANAISALNRASRGERPVSSAAVWDPATSAAALTDLRALLEDSGWASSSGKKDWCRVDLELTRGRQQATVMREPNFIRMHADLLDCPEEPDAACAYAASLFLLSCASGTRLIAATADLREPAFIPRLQVVLPAGATPEWLGHGLAALSVAYDLAVEEIEALSQDASLARRYLALQTETGATPAVAQPSP